MPQLSLGCPHCGTDPVGFSPIAAVQVKPGMAHTLLFLQCGACGHGVVAVTNMGLGAANAWIGGTATSPGNLLKFFPERKELKCPADVPKAVSDAYLSGLENLGRKNGTNAAAMMFRRSIEIATKVIPEALKSGTLQKRIEALPPDIATPAMKEWAHHVRLDANEATHEVEEFTEEDAKKLQTFTEMFLTYAFTLPAMLKRAKEGRS
jgi:hypothetical protein